MPQPAVATLTTVSE